MADLHVWTDGECWCVATDPRHAADLAGYDAGDVASTWRVLDDEEVLTIRYEDEGRVTKTCAEWGAEFGPAIIGSIHF